MTAAVQYMLTRATIFEAARATVWLTGSLNGRSWGHVRPVAAGLIVLVPCALILGRQLRVLEMGDDAAKGLGVRVERSRLGLILCAVGLAALATASAGPVAFVAFFAPAIARRVVGSGQIALVPSALMGSAVVLASDLIARRILAPTELPVGRRHVDHRRPVSPVPAVDRELVRPWRLTQPRHRASPSLQDA